MDLLVGTSGFSYPEWKGSFYPEKLPATRMLSYYAERFTTVEINNTFYRMPAAATLASWSQQVPLGFRFVLKVPRRITHQAQLIGVEQPVDYFFTTCGALDSKLGPALFQLPPSLRMDLSRLEHFLAVLPPGARTAIEFRHPSWRTPEVLALLRAQGVALCLADTDETPLEAELPATASWGYLRLRRKNYSEQDLRRWLERLAAQPWEEIFIFFKHEEGGAAPAQALRLMELHAPAKRVRPRGG